MSESTTLSAREQEILTLFARLRQLAPGFAKKSRSELMRDSIDTSLSPSVLNIAQAFSRGCVVSDRDLFLLRDVSLALKASPYLKSISTLLVNEEYIAGTYRDMMSKRAALDPDYKTPCNMSRLLSLGSDAVKFGSSRSYSPCDVAVFSSDDSTAKRINCALNGYFPTESPLVFEKKDAPIRKVKRLSDCQAAVFYTRDKERTGDLEKFFSDPVNTSGVVGAFSCSPRELFTKLLSLNAGFSINADMLPEVNLLLHIPREYRALIKTSLSFFDEVIFGDTAVVIIASKSKLENTSLLAARRGLSVCKLLSFKSQKDVSITVQNKTVARLGIDLVRTLRDMIGYSAEITTHQFNSVAKETKTEKIFEDKNGETAVYKSEVNVSLSPAPYHETLYNAIGLITRAVKDGFRSDSSELYFSVSASLSLDDSRAIGAAVSSILGLYRAETELGIPEEHSSIGHSGGDSKLTICLKAYSTQRADTIKDFDSIDPLIFSSIDENGIPDLKALKLFAKGAQAPHIIERFEA